MNTINSIDELRNSIVLSTTILVKGYYTPGDGGGGEFYWDNNSSEQDNGGTIIKVLSNSIGRWIRLYKKRIDIRCFGALGDGESSGAPDYVWTGRDNHESIKSAIKLAETVNEGIELYFPYGKYLSEKTIEIDSVKNLTLLSDVAGTSIIYNGPNDESSLFNINNSAFINFKGLSLQISRQLAILGTLCNIIYAKKSPYLKVLECDISFGNKGIFLDGGCYIVYITNSKISNCINAINLTRVNGSQVNVTISNNTFGDMWEPQLESEEYTCIKNDSNGTIINNNYFETKYDTYTILGCSGAQFMTIDGNFFYNSGGIKTDCSASISSNTIHTVNTNCLIGIHSRTGASITGNILDMSVTDEPTNYKAKGIYIAGKGTVSANKVSNSAFFGIGCVSQSIINANHITCKSGCGIQVFNGNNNIISGNILNALFIPPPPDQTIPPGSNFAIILSGNNHSIYGNMSLNGDTSFYNTERNNFTGNIGPTGKNKISNIGEIPTTGTWLKGDKFYLTNPTAGGYIGYICTVGGSPGTWKGFGEIEN
jgi:hypothetical protein